MCNESHPVKICADQQPVPRPTHEERAAQCKHLPDKCDRLLVASVVLRPLLGALNRVLALFSLSPSLKRESRLKKKGKVILHQLVTSFDLLQYKYNTAWFITIQQHNTMKVFFLSSDFPSFPGFFAVKISNVKFVIFGENKKHVVMNQRWYLLGKYPFNEKNKWRRMKRKTTDNISISIGS